MPTKEKSGYETAQGEFKSTNEIGDGLVGNVDGRLLWLEMMTALDQCLPSDPPDKRPEDIGDRNEIHISELECEWFPDLATWYAVGDLGEDQRDESLGDADAATCKAPGSARRRSSGSDWAE